MKGWLAVLLAWLLTAPAMAHVATPRVTYPRLLGTVSPRGFSNYCVFDAVGRISTVREPSGQTGTNQYDALSRLTNVTDAAGVRAFRYDANGNRTQAIEAGKTNVWTFDDADRVSSYQDSEGNLIQYGYDQNGNLTNLVYPGGRAVRYGYDALNRLTSLTDWANRQTSFEYDLAGQVTAIRRPNGTVRSIGYDAAGETTNITETTAGNVPITAFKLEWNAAARVQREWSGPPPHRVTPPTRTLTFDDDNRIATFNGQSVGYDADGNLTNGPLTSATLSAYGYDARNRLMSAGGLIYTYDPAGNRVVVTSAGVTTRYVVNPNAALSQVLMRVRPGVTNYYVHGLGLLYEVTETASSTNVLTYHFDYRGSTVALTDSAGNVTDRAEYSAYGLLTYRGGTTDTPFLFNGRYGVMTDANGLLYMRARYYNPYLCRFLNPDPAGFAGGLNFYCFADGNSVSMIDPFGLCAQAATIRGWIERPETMPTVAELIQSPNAVPLQFDDIRTANGLAVTTLPALGPAGIASALNGGIEWIKSSLGYGDNGDPPLVAGTISGNRSLTPTESAEIQSLATKYNTTIDVVGSRAAEEGNNIHTSLPVGHNSRTQRSDIDFRVDATHTQADELIKELKGVGNGAGSADKRFSTTTRATRPPFIRFVPKKP